MNRPVDGPDFGWVLELPGDSGSEPLFLRLSRAIATDIRRGRIGPGSRLPGSRALARSLAIHRNTVLAAFSELLAEGWIETRQGRGTFVSSSLPEVKPKSFVQKLEPRRTRRPPKTANAPDSGSSPMPGLPLPRSDWATRVGFAFEAGAEPIPLQRAYPRTALRLLGGLPDLRLLPNEAFARAQRRVLRRSVECLGYGDAFGHARLRVAIAAMLRAQRGLLTEPEDVLVTRGSQMALALAAQTVLRPGDVVAIESYGYLPAWQALRSAGARIVPVPVDAQGLSVRALAALCERETVRAIYVTPHHQFPTTVAMAPGRRIELLALAARVGFAILEDDYDHDFHYEGRPLLPLASADPSSLVIYVGTFSKIFAPGLRIGYVVAPRAVLTEMARRRFYLDRQGDQVSECALAELLEDGELQRHVRRMRRVYHARRDACARLLREHLADALSFRVPHGGMALWARVDASIDAERWTAAAEREGVIIYSGRHYDWHEKARQFLRIGYASLSEAELEEAVRRLVRAARKHSALEPPRK